MLAEVAPFLVPQFDALLVSLLVIAACMVALGLVTVLHDFTRATVGGLGQLLGHVPGLGKVLSSPVNAVVHWMDSEFGRAETALDGILAQFLHSLGALVHWWAKEIGDLANLVHMLAAVALGTAAIDNLNRLVGVISHRVAGVEHAADLALSRIRGLEALTLHRIEALIEPRIAALEHAIADVIPNDIAGLREYVGRVLGQLDNVWRLVREHDALFGAAAITGAVAFALPRLGLSWIRCRNWRRIGEGVCALPFDLVDALLLGTLDALVVSDLCGFAGLLTASAKAIEPALLEFVDVEDALIGCHGASKPPSLVLTQFQLPPVTTPLSLVA